MLATLDQFAGYWKRDLSPADAYTAELLIDMATDDIRTHCGWHIAPTVTETVTVDGSGGEVQTLPTLHLVDLIAVADDGTDLTVADVEWSVAGYMKRPGYRWTSRLRGVVAEIEHGYAEVPMGLVGLVCDLVARSMTKPPGVARESSGGESVNYDLAEMTDRDIRMLDRRWSIKARA